MYSVTDTLQTQTAPSYLDELLKSKGALPSASPITEGQDKASTPLTVASFSPQSIVMSNATNAQGGLLQSVMSAAANSGAESTAERTLFGKQAATNLMQTMQKDSFEQSFTDLLEGLRTDIEESVEETLNEESTETPIAEMQVTTETTVDASGNPVSTTEAEGTSTEGASTEAPAPQVTTTEVTAAPAEATPESAKAPTQESVDIYV